MRQRVRPASTTGPNTDASPACADTNPGANPNSGANPNTASD